MDSNPFLVMEKYKWQNNWLHKEWYKVRVQLFEEKKLCKCEEFQNMFFALKKYGLFDLSL